MDGGRKVGEKGEGLAVAETHNRYVINNPKNISTRREKGEVVGGGGTFAGFLFVIWQYTGKNNFYVQHVLC